MISFLKIEIPIAVASKTETSIFLFSREERPFLKYFIE
ncbi:hypothetical protein QGQ_0569 [Clostridioides difficile 342]|nr:hypothetical protein QEA_0645 [Clostridioides difficile CD109]EQF46968.1 hypothetical protein QEI_0492 [Clostridioides difficile CD129]EQF84279.1 hypothetical protein QGQ_0569 [Clostridioides difficile 342]EQG03237.1 hypothetical protein QGY_0489 [Clostridioides difficile 840]EQG06217.1 hypothetical protein QI7_2299 [Clostridioides difficile 6042]EQG47014.1 hypothetical protein QIU_0581 [Clostridioides difficile DA00132]EQG49206.1 hypothetical protein QIW_0646 [Clostridioides difficile DA0